MSAARLPEGLHTDPVKWTKPKQPRVATEHRRAIKALKAEANRRGQALKPFMRKQALESEPLVLQQGELTLLTTCRSLMPSAALGCKNAALIYLGS